MKIILFLFTVTILALISVVMMNPLLVISFAFILVANSYYKQAFLIAFYSSILYSLFLPSSGILSLGVLTLITMILLFTLSIVKIRLLDSQFILFSVAVSLTIAAHFIMFKTFSSLLLVTDLLIFIFGVIIVPKWLRMFSKSSNFLIS